MRFTVTQENTFGYNQFSSAKAAGTIKVCRLVVGLLVIASTVPGRSQDSNSLLASWLNAQTNIQSWSADFTQVRSLKALTQPLTSTGHVWFAAPNRFHWELGNPAQTIAVRQTDQLLVIYPRLKRVERYPLTGVDASQWRDTLALLDAGFPRSRAEVESRFNILSQTNSHGVHELALQPKSETARRFMPQIKIGFDTNTFALRSTELQFQDGSTMQNVFTNAQLNPKIDEQLFNPSIEGYKVVEPLKKQP
jgi:outer membrane lipoprotein carrier protein